MVIRISIDDGAKQDMRVADILDKYKLKGIFYIAPYKSDLRVVDIAELGKKHEIGGHTLNHALLTLLDEESAKIEIKEGKRILEEIIGKTITKFAYCRGWFNEDVKRWVKECGFLEGRTIKFTQTELKNYDKFEIPCTAHIYPREEYKEKGIVKSIIERFEESKKFGYFNLVLHSWEVERFKLWEEFEQIIDYISRNK